MVAEDAMSAVAGMAADTPMQEAQQAIADVPVVDQHPQAAAVLADTE
jgi:hypothetical protein